MDIPKKRGRKPKILAIEAGAEGLDRVEPQSTNNDAVRFRELIEHLVRENISTHVLPPKNNFQMGVDFGLKFMCQMSQSNPLILLMTFVK